MTENTSNFDFFLEKQNALKTQTNICAMHDEDAADISKFCSEISVQTILILAMHHILDNKLTLMKTKYWN